jgi:hypothetical protein
MRPIADSLPTGKQESTGIASTWRSVRETVKRFGLMGAAQLTFYRLINRVCYFEVLYIIRLDRSRLRPLDAQAVERLSCRVATTEDIDALRGNRRWDLTDELQSNFRRGDSCLLSYVDGQLAGYTWVHEQGRPELMRGLSITIPPQFLYNYAGLTLAEFRGAGLQPYRHHAVLNREQWKGRDALIGYVRFANLASRRGQDKSGYRRIGSIWLIGSRRNFAVLFSPALKALGIRRA